MLLGRSYTCWVSRAYDGLTSYLFVYLSALYRGFPPTIEYNLQILSIFLVGGRSWGRLPGGISYGAKKELLGMDKLAIEQYTSIFLVSVYVNTIFHIYILSSFL